MKMYVKLKDIAERAGVSVNTVSRALRNGSDIGEDTKRKICELAEEMGYVPNEIHSYTFSGMSKIIGVATPSTTNPFVFIMLSKLMEELDKMNYSPLIVRCAEGMMHDEHLKNLLGKRVCGIISFNNVDEEVEQKVKQYKLPFVMVGTNSRGRDINAVFIDDFECGEIIGDELSRSDRKKPCFVACGTGVNERGAKLFEKAEKLGLVCDKYIYDYDTFDIADIICKDIINNGNDFIYCFNDEIALKLIVALDECGYKDYDIYGIDGITHYMPLFRKISSLSCDYSAMIKVAVQRIFEILDDQDAEYKTSQTVFPVSLEKY